MKNRTHFGVCMRLIGLVRPLTGYMLLAVFLGVAGHLCASMIPVLGGVALLDLLGEDVLFSARTVFFCVAVFALLRGAFRYGEQYCNHFIAFKLLALIRDRVFASLRRLCPAKLEGKDKGNLISLITSDIELLEVFYAHTISPAAIALLIAVFMGTILALLHPAAAVIALLAYLTVGVIIPVSTSKRSGRDGMDFRARSGDLSAFVLDSLRGLSELLQYSMGQKRLAQMDEKTDLLTAGEKSMRLRAGTNTAVTQAAILLSNLLMLSVMTLLCIRGDLSFPRAMTAVLVLMSSFGPFVSLSDLGSGLQKTFASGNRVLDLLEETPETEEIEGNPSCSFTGAEVRNVTFSYGGDRILDGVSASFPENAIVGITGKSGSGKSTLLKLLMRFWTADEGEVAVSGRSVNEINTSDLRDMQSFMTQETHLFHDTIAGNLRIARLDASQEELEAACKKAAVHDFIMTLPKGYDTEVGELGSTLSGGERQRLGLARAFLHDAPFLLLDEPTSNLDSLNEAVILTSIARERANKTVVLVSHRASTMNLADKKYSVEHGRMS